MRGAFFLDFEKKGLTEKRECAIICNSPGGVAQLGARLNGIQKVEGSNPFISTNIFLFFLRGGVAQLGERSVRIREVEGSNPFVSTRKDCR